MKRVKIVWLVIVLLLSLSACERKLTPPPPDLSKRMEVDVERKEEEEKANREEEKQKEEEKKEEEKKKIEKQAKAELQKENYTTYFDGKTGWNVYESFYDGFDLEIKFPNNWKIDKRVTRKYDFSTEQYIGIHSPDFLFEEDENLGIIGIKEGSSLGLTVYFPYLRQESIEKFDPGDFETVGKEIERKYIKIDDIDALQITWEGDGFPVSPKGIMKISSRIYLVYKKHLILFGLGTAGDHRKQNYDFLVNLINLVKIESK